MSESTKHTDLPWVAVNDNPHSDDIWYIRHARLEIGVNEVAMLTSGSDAKMDAEFIVTAVNERDALLAENKRLREALEAIERWQLPPTEQFGPNGEPMSYGAAYGSNGERDYMRSVAREALKGKDSSMRRGETDADTHGLR